MYASHTGRSGRRVQEARNVDERLCYIVPPKIHQTITTDKHPTVAETVGSSIEL